MPAFVTAVPARTAKVASVPNGTPAPSTAFCAQLSAVGDGDGDGDADGVADGDADGDALGDAVGVGDADGDPDGLGDGFGVGEGFGVGHGLGLRRWQFAPKPTVVFCELSLAVAVAVVDAVDAVDAVVVLVPATATAPG
jgi:hypothetical protein